MDLRIFFLSEEVIFPEPLDTQESAIGPEELPMDILHGVSGTMSMKVGYSKAVTLEDLMDLADVNKILEFEDVEVEEVLNYDAGNVDEYDYQNEFLNREEGRVHQEPLIRDMWCLTRWDPRHCGCRYKVDIHGNEYFLPSWWKYFVSKLQ